MRRCCSSDRAGPAHRHLDLEASGGKRALSVLAQGVLFVALMNINESRGLAVRWDNETLTTGSTLAAVARGFWIAVGTLAMVVVTGCDNGASPRGASGSGGRSVGAGSGGALSGGSTGSGGSVGSGGSGGSTGTGGSAGSVGATGGAGGTTDAAWLAPPVVPDAIKVPAGATVVLRLHATGAQVYACTASSVGGAGGAGGAGGMAGMAGAGGAGTSAAGGSAGGQGGAATTTYSWVLKAPDARLFDRTGTEVGIHSAGPTWTSSVDGSAVVGMKVEQANAPMADAIPWLLLRAASTSGRGVFSTVTFIHRVETMKGKAPTVGCDASAVGTETRVDYAAEYFFYQGGIGTDTDGGADATAG